MILRGTATGVDDYPLAQGAGRRAASRLELAEPGWPVASGASQDDLLRRSVAILRGTRLGTGNRATGKTTRMLAGSVDHSEEPICNSASHVLARLVEDPLGQGAAFWRVLVVHNSLTLLPQRYLAGGSPELVPVDTLFRCSNCRIVCARASSPALRRDRRNRYQSTNASVGGRRRGPACGRLRHALRTGSSHSAPCVGQTVKAGRDQSSLNVERAGARSRLRGGWSRSGAHSGISSALSRYCRASASAVRLSIRARTSLRAPSSQAGTHVRVRSSPCTTRAWGLRYRQAAFPLCRV